MFSNMANRAAAMQAAVAPVPAAAPAAAPAAVPQPTLPQPTLPQPGPNGPNPGNCPPAKYEFTGAEDAIQLFISEFHIGVLLMGAAALVGGCVGMQIAGGRTKQKEEESESEDE